MKTPLSHPPIAFSRAIPEKKYDKNSIFSSKKFGGSTKSSTFATAKRNDTVLL